MRWIARDQVSVDREIGGPPNAVNLAAHASD
jgi:hypothetical protein